MNESLENIIENEIQEYLKETGVHELSKLDVHKISVKISLAVLEKFPTTLWK